jgi:pilus assembly protein CpaF
MNGKGDPNKRVSPLVPGRSGRVNISLEALRERIERQFQEETERRGDILRDLNTPKQRRALLREVADYVLAMEQVRLPIKVLSPLLEIAYRNLFSFGPLDDFLQDNSVTEVTINGPNTVHIRHGMGKLEAIPGTFDDHAHLEALLERVLATSGAMLSKSEPFIEIGVVLGGRAARMSVIGPPVKPDYSLEIRLHPLVPILLDNLPSVPPQAAVLLKAIIKSGHGLLIVGEPGLGKTTLTSALIRTLRVDSIIVERAAEVHLPLVVKRRIPIPATRENPGSDFVSEIRAALDERPNWLIIDEIRGDESSAVWDALTRADAPHYIWVFRGDSQADRLRTALSMVIRKEHPAVEQEAIHAALAQHLPFVAAFKMINGVPRLSLVAEWAKTESDLILIPLLSEQDSGWLAVGEHPTRALDLPDEFWS